MSQSPPMLDQLRRPKKPDDGHPGMVLGNDLTFEVGAVAAVSGHGLSSSESPLPVNRKTLELSNPRGALQIHKQAFFSPPPL